MRINHFLIYCGLLIAIGVSYGCSASKKESYVSGKITFNGIPIDTGVIQFIPIAGDNFEGGGRIEAGKYKAIVPFGTSKVNIQGGIYTGEAEVSSDREAPMTGGGGIPVNPIPIHFWNKSEITVDVKKNKEQHDFHLKSE